MVTTKHINYIMLRVSDPLYKKIKLFAGKESLPVATFVKAYLSKSLKEEQPAEMVTKQTADCLSEQ